MHSSLFVPQWSAVRAPSQRLKDTCKPIPLLVPAEQPAHHGSSSAPGADLSDLRRLCLEVNGLPAHEMDAGLVHLLIRLGTLLKVQRVECSLISLGPSGRLHTQLWQAWSTPDLSQRADFTQTLAHTVPLTAHAHFLFSLKRTARTPEFDAQERDWLACALAGLGRWLQWLALSHGIPSALGPFPPQQRKVLLCLLSGFSEKQMADKLGLNIHTTHQCITAIYRRFKVRNRPSLTARWLEGIAP
jgi:DNA-binding CsgD family transcriptional regulator